MKYFYKMPFVMKLSSPRRRLYLSKDGDGIYIDNCNLHSHQRDGIRFIYSQFKMKSPGIILNDPPGYGKKLQIVLFIKAIRHLLEDSVLIICNEDAAASWLKHFHQWTEFGDDVCVENTNPYKKKSIIINTMENIQMFTNRERSIIIIDSDIITKEMMKISYKCEYKVWMTSVEMKEDLELFSKIYSWIHPKEKVDIDKFRMNKNDPSDCIQKTILFDTFAEDLVKRSEDFSALVPVDKKTTTPVKPSRKKKDITGTKIKRTKRRIEDYDDDENDLPNIHFKIIHKAKQNNDIVQNIEKQEDNEIKHDNVTKNNNGNEVNDRGDTCKMDVDTFIEPLGSKIKHEIHDVASSTTNSVNLFETVEFNKLHNINSKNTETIVNVENNLVRENEVKIEDVESAIENNVILDEIVNKNAVLESNDNELINDHKMNVDESAVDASENQGRKDMDTMMKEYENKVNNKFKGSFLDSLF